MGDAVTVLVTGITGYVGGRLAERLHAGGISVRGFARRPEAVELPVPVVGGDAVTGAGLEAALAGIDVAYFLIHSMETSGDANGFGQREQTAAQRFADAAARAGVRRIVYLGGPEPRGARSAHLASRLGVERILLDAVPDSIALRASLVIGARSRSFRLLVRLVERLPVLAVPGWGGFRTSPIDERDLLAMLLAAREARAGGQALDAAGADVLTYRELLERIADLMLLGRPAVGLHGLSVTPVASRVAAAIAEEDPALIRPLMESLEGDLLPSITLAAPTLEVRLHSLDAAIEHALADWERAEPLAAR